MRERFRVCDLVVESNVALPELPRAAEGSPECRFELLPAGEADGGDFEWFHHWRFTDEDETPWLSFAHHGADYLLRFPSQGDFLVSRDGGRVRCRPLPDTPESTVRHLFLDQIVPLILSRRGRLVLHASAVVTDQGAIAFAGMSGQGKSTLAASFAQDGRPLVSDDCLVLREAREGWAAVPSYPGVRLWPETAGNLFDTPPPSSEVAHYTVKLRVGNPELLPFAEAPCLVKRLYFLDGEETTAGEVSIAPLVPHEAFMKLVNFTYNIDITDRELLKYQFDVIGRLTTQVRCYRLCYARGFPTLPAVRQAILSHPTEGESR